MGTVVEVRFKKPARCRVQLGDNTTDWLQWIAGRAGGIGGCRWWPPVVGEQCLVISPGGDLAQGIVLLGAYSDTMDAPSEKEGHDITQWSERSSLHYSVDNRVEKLAACTKDGISLEVVGEPDQTSTSTSITLLPGLITLKVGEAVLTIGPNRITSNVDIVVQGISAVSHVHGGVIKGGANTEVPAR